MNQTNILIALCTPEVLGAIITAIAGFATSIFTYIASNQVRDRRRNLRLEHLTNLYEPLVKILSYHKYTMPEAKRKAISELVEKQYRYATPRIIKEIQNLPGTVDESCFNQLREIVMTIYNWHLKKLGYAYDKDYTGFWHLFKTDYVPKAWKRNFQLIDVTVYIALFFSLTIALLALAVAFYNLYLVVRELTSLLILFIVTIGILGGLFSNSRNHE